MEELSIKKTTGPINRPKLYNGHHEELPLQVLPKKVIENYQIWELIERIQNYGFFSCRSVTGGRPMFCTSLIRVDDVNREFMTPPVWEDDSNPMRPLDHTPRQYSRELIYADFLASIENNEKAISRRQAEAEALLIKDALIQKNSKIVNDMRSQGEHLKVELQELTDLSENSHGIFSNKRCKEILLQLSQIELFFKNIKLY